jgi:protein DGCR14
MLLSPGHSPRHLSSPSPSSNPERTLQISYNVSSINNTPIYPRKRSTVLDEDSYVAAIEKIIERDFFPDISKLRDRFDWLEAMKTGDPIQIRDAQLKIMERRGKMVKNIHSDGSNRARNQTQTQTPGSAFIGNFTQFDEFDSRMQTPSVVMDRGLSSNAESSENENENENENAVDENLGLDDFFRRYTSEDNDSFSKILEKGNRKRKERYGHFLEGEKKDVKLIGDAKRDRITDGFGTSDQPPSTLEGWKYTAKNLLMYHPADRGEAPLTEEERAVRLKGLTREINMSNTRFHGKMLDTRPKDDGVVEVIYTPVVGATPLPMYG